MPGLIPSRAGPSDAEADPAGRRGPGPVRSAPLRSAPASTSLPSAASRRTVPPRTGLTGLARPWRPTRLGLPWSASARIRVPGAEWPGSRPDASLSPVGSVNAGSPATKPGAPCADAAAGAPVPRRALGTTRVAAVDGRASCRGRATRARRAGPVVGGSTVSGLRDPSTERSRASCGSDWAVVDRGRAAGVDLLAARERLGRAAPLRGSAATETGGCSTPVPERSERVGLDPTPAARAAGAPARERLGPDAPLRGLAETDGCSGPIPERSEGLGLDPTPAARGARDRGGVDPTGTRSPGTAESGSRTGGDRCADFAGLRGGADAAPGARDRRPVVAAEPSTADPASFSSEGPFCCRGGCGRRPEVARFCVGLETPAPADSFTAAPVPSRTDPEFERSDVGGGDCVDDRRGAFTCLRLPAAAPETSAPESAGTESVKLGCGRGGCVDGRPADADRFRAGAGTTAPGDAPTATPDALERATARTDSVKPGCAEDTRLRLDEETMPTAGPSIAAPAPSGRDIAGLEGTGSVTPGRVGDLRADVDLFRVGAGTIAATGSPTLAPGLSDPGPVGTESVGVGRGREDVAVDVRARLPLGEEAIAPAGPPDPSGPEPVGTESVRVGCEMEDGAVDPRADRFRRGAEPELSGDSPDSSGRAPARTDSAKPGCWRADAERFRAGTETGVPADSADTAGTNSARSGFDDRLVDVPRFRLGTEAA